MCSADTFLQLTEVSESDPDCMHFWQEQVDSAFVYAEKTLKASKGWYGHLSEMMVP